LGRVKAVVEEEEEEEEEGSEEEEEEEELREEEAVADRGGEVVGSFDRDDEEDREEDRDEDEAVGFVGVFEEESVLVGTREDEPACTG
jgi:hypothetical protein